MMNVLSITIAKSFNHPVTIFSAIIHEGCVVLKQKNDEMWSGNN